MEKLDNLLSLEQKPPRSWEDILALCQSSTNWISDKISQFLNLVDKNFNVERESPLEEFYPNQLNMSSSGLRRNCKRVLNVTPTYCVQARLIFEARTIFDKNRKLQMKEVAGKLGIDEYHFSKLFKKHTGLTFSNYRKTLP